MYPDTHTDNPNMVGFQIKKDTSLREEDLNRLKAADQLINVVLGEMQYINKLLGHHAQIAPVENIQQKIEAAYKRINDNINKREQALEQGLESGSPQDSGPSVEKHPLLPELGGMNLDWDKMDKEWMEALGIDNLQDQAEVQNQIKEKLQNRIKNALKLASKLQNKIRNQPAFKPVQKQVNDLVVKYKMTLDDLKNKPILQPQAPEYRPAPPPPRPTPM